MDLGEFISRLHRLPHSTDQLVINSIHNNGCLGGDKETAGKKTLWPKGTKLLLSCA